MAARLKGLLGDTVQEDWHSQLPGTYIDPFTGELRAQKVDPRFLWMEPNDMTQDQNEGQYTPWVPRDRAVGLLGLT